MLFIHEIATANHKLLIKHVFYMKHILSIVAFVAIVAIAHGQDRLKRGAIYQQGEAIYAPMVGYKGVVPTGWFGTIPQNEEYFLMIPNSNTTGYMFVNANKQNLTQLAGMWKTSFALTDNIIITIKGEPKISGNIMTADFTVSGAREPAVHNPQQVHVPLKL